MASNEIRQIIKNAKYNQRDLYSLQPYEIVFLKKKAKELGVEGMDEFLAGDRNLKKGVK